MLFKKKNHLIGLDIGSQSIKVGEVIKTSKGRMLKNLCIADIDSGLIEDGAILKPETLAHSIRELLNLNKIKTENVAVSIGGYSVIIEKIDVPDASEKELQKTIPYEAEQYIPFNIEDVNIDYYILGKNETKPNHLNILIVAVKREIIEDYTGLIHMAGLNPCVIDVDTFALQNTLDYNYNLENKNTVLIDIGASKTTLNILQGSDSLFTRDVSLGCGQINQQIIEKIHCSPKESEKIKFQVKPEKISQKDLSEIESETVTEWCTEIKRAIDYFYSTNVDTTIRRIILSGGGANIKAFRINLARRTSIQVEIINPFNRLIVNQNRFKQEYIDNIAPQVAICLGLALRRVDDK